MTDRIVYGVTDVATRGRVAAALAALAALAAVELPCDFAVVSAVTPAMPAGR